MPKISQDTLCRLVSERLSTHGWVLPTVPSACLASKWFVTAVGDKEAIAYLSLGDEFNRTLSAQYYSEGRNALAAESVLIPLDAAQDAVLDLVDRFAAQVDAAVDVSYARRLHLGSEANR